MRIALINSGLGLLAAAAELHRLRPDADLVLAMDPDGMPWGPRTPDDIAARSLAGARAAVAYRPDGKMVASAGFEGTVYLNDPENGKLLREESQAHKYRVPGSGSWRYELVWTD